MPDSLLTITGGAGRIGTALTPLLREHYRIRLADVRRPDTSVEYDDFVEGDVADRAAADRAVAGAQAVLHLAGNPSTSANWGEVLATNIDGTYQIFDAARRHDVSKVVFASTNHVMGFYALEGKFPIDTASAIRPDSLYGVSKACGEALARFFSDAFGMSMICLRIGWFTPTQPNAPALNPLWVSTRDLAQIVRQCLETSRAFGIYNATSDNTQREWDLTASRDELGYSPVDNVTQLPPLGEAPHAGTYVDPRAGVLRSGPG